MSKYKVIITQVAQDKLMAMADYIAYEFCDVKAARNLISGMRRFINGLDTFPQRYGVEEKEPLKSYKIRKATYNQYKIYFWINEDTHTVYVEAIFHELSDVNRHVSRILINYK